MSCLAAPGYYCSPLDGTVLLCQANRYCLGGSYAPRACPGSTWAPAGSATLDACRDNMDTAFAATLALILVFLFVFIGVWLCWATVPAVPPAPVVYYPPPETAPLLPVNPPGWRYNSRGPYP